MKKQKVILIHGLYLHGSALLWLKRKLEKCGWEVMLFSYSSLRNTTEENVALLEIFISNLDAAIVHIVGHSLGGLLIRHLGHRNPQLITGHAITLGTPHEGSVVAQVTQNIHKIFIGRAFTDALDGNAPPWPKYVPLGSIAGSSEIGIGMFYRELPKPNDGTISVSETQFEHMTDHIVLPVSHTSMIYDKSVVTQVHAFLLNQRFIHSNDLTTLLPCF